jgi:hypothetical protein
MDGRCGERSGFASDGAGGAGVTSEEVDDVVAEVGGAAVDVAGDAVGAEGDDGPAVEAVILRGQLAVAPAQGVGADDGFGDEGAGGGGGARARADDAQGE